MVECPCPPPNHHIEGGAQNHRPACPKQPQSSPHWAASVTAAALILGLTACGGNDDTPSPPPAVGTEQAINTTNATQVAGEALHSILLPMGGFDSLVESNFIFIAAPPSTSVRAKLLRLASAAGKVQPQAAVSVNTACGTNGQLRRTVSQAVQGKLTVGDFAEVQFDACVQDGVESVGKGREVVTAVNDSQRSFTVQGELTGFGSSGTGVVVLASGPYSLATDRTNPAQAKVTVSADSAINVERRINQQAVAAYSLEGLKRTIELDSAAGGAILFDINYTAKGRFPQLGSTQFQITTPGKLGINDDGDFIGTIKVVSSDSSSLRLTFQEGSADTLRLDLDVNGDGTIDQTQSLTLDELLRLILVAQ
jgi:hypothetical protein